MGYILPGIMIAIQLEADELQVLTQTLESAYRAQHREVFDAGSGQDPSYLEAARRRLQTLEFLLRKCGSSPAGAMQVVL